MSEATILIVDDDDVLGQILTRVLTQQGYHVERASDAAQAVQLACQTPPQLALLDLCLPDQDGIDLAQELRQQLPDLPLILMTAYPLSLREHPERVQGFARVLTKPLNLQELRQAVESALGHPSTAAAEPAPPMTEFPAMPLPPPASVHAAAPALPAPPPPPTIPPPESPPPPRRRWLLAVGAVAALLICATVGVGLLYQDFILGPRSAREADAATPPAIQAELVAGKPNTIRLPSDVVARLGIQTAEAAVAKQPQPLELSGSLALDANHLARVHTRFAGELIELGQIDGRPVSRGDWVHGPVKDTSGNVLQPGQLLAVVWSKELGEKKSELVDALSQLRLDKETLTNLEDLYRKGATSEANYRQALRNYESDLNAVAKAERTLRTWRLSEQEIQEVKDEAERIKQRQGKHDHEKEKSWARVEVRAPFDGVIVEKNVTVGDILDTSWDMFRIADVTHLEVWAHAYEESLPALLRLKPKEREWTIRLKSDPKAPPMHGTFDAPGYVLDLNQHTALVMGLVDNPEGILRAGQFVTATIELDPPQDVVVIPSNALVEDGQDSIVFVQENPDLPEYTMRPVVVEQRRSNTILVRSLKKTDLQPHDLLVVQSVVELKAALEDLKSSSQNEKP